ncbi:MAG TPA: 4Fe-4S dicluster domain-containing protein [Vicinamibacteria bacterium]|nr:4Fe-4S dicluster domain-containing protein [Vicinamibacteria bacterium]
MRQQDVGTIAKPDLREWVERLLAEAEVIAPTPAHGGDVLFATIRSADEVLWDFENPLAPPKPLVLPQTEPLVRIRRRNGRLALEPVDDARPRVLLNARSCDVKGMAFLRQMMAAEPADEAWLRRADRLTLVSLACNDPCRQGFCVCCDAGPSLREGYDLQLTDLGDRLLAEAASERGRRTLAAAGRALRPAREQDLDRRAELEGEARRRFGRETCHFGSAMRRLSAGRVEPELWEQASDWCQQCGACSYLCPVCYCFSVADRREDGGFLRCRLWDSCQLSAFTLEASGHNPRHQPAERIKRRLFHKVSAQYYRRDGSVGCVGCGRCVRACLGTTDLPALVAAVREGTWNG